MSLWSHWANFQKPRRIFSDEKGVDVSGFIEDDELDMEHLLGAWPEEIDLLLS